MACRGDIRERVIPARTLRAYRKTHYQVAGIGIHIGRHCRTMDRLLASHGTREAVFITAHNPFSRRMPDGWNQRMQVRLTETLRRRQALPAKGSWRHWSEAHVLVLGDARPTCRLASLFRQNGIVIIRRGQRAQLRLTGHATADHPQRRSPAARAR